jgi:hypothetical protein
MTRGDFANDVPHAIESLACRRSIRAAPRFSEIGNLRNFHMAYTVAQLLRMKQSELDDLFKKKKAGPIPNGEANGTAIIAPGTVLSPEAASFINHFAWQGKVFDAKAGLLKNRILPFGLNAIVARVYKAPSWLDKKECIVLDYSQTSILAQWIRDEIRQIQPKMYLGKVYWNKARLIDFVLEF